MKNATKMLLAVCVVSLLVAATAQAATVTVQQGVDQGDGNGVYAGTDDTSLWTDGAGNTHRNYGARTYLFAGDPYANGPAGTNRIGRPMMRFDLSGVISGATSVSSISLKLKEDGGVTTKGSGTINIYRIAAANAAWVEGTGNSTPDLAGTADWSHLSHDDTDWAGSAGLSTAGTDYVATLLGSISFDATVGATYTVNLAASDAALRLSLIQEWSGTQANNAGLLFIADTDVAGGGGSNTEGLVVASAENATLSFRPELTVEYVPEPATMSLLGIGGLLALVRRKR